MKRFLILTFVIGIFFPSISNASCKDDYSKSWKFSGSDAIEITVENNTNRKIILVSFKIYTASEELMKTIPLNKTLEPYGVFEKYLFHKLNKRLIKLGGFSCKYHASVLEKKRREEEKKRAQERIKEDIEKRKKAEEVRKKNEEAWKKNEAARKKAEEEGKRKAEEEKRAEEKRNEENYLKNKTYKVVLTRHFQDVSIGLSKREGIFKEEKVLGSNVVLGKFTTTKTEIPTAVAGEFYGSAFHNGGVEYAVQYLICVNEELDFVKYNIKTLKLNKDCDPLKIQLIDYENYLEEERKKARNKKITFSIVIVLIISLVIYLAMARRKKDVINYNKKHNKSFKTYDDLQKHLNKLRSQKEEKERKEEERKALLEEKRLEKERKKEEAKKQEEEKRLEKERQKEVQRLAKEEKAAASEPSVGSLTSNIARLKKLYKNGTLTKAEFEKAKNNLLK